MSYHSYLFFTLCDPQTRNLIQCVLGQREGGRKRREFVENEGRGGGLGGRSGV